ncbi:MAG: enoyl-CoA hydratase/isomerase family protein [Ignavibacteria bacterium]|nr:enoyl-CoA hydratase/isomerase family protein [Ignavibacteria bacterium]
MNFLEIEEQGGIATVRLNRPEKRNALGPALLSEIQAAFSSLGARKDISVIILEGAGKAFCAGADLEYLEHMSGFSIQENHQDSLHLKTAFHAVYTCPKPVIAKVHGPAIAGGCGLATVCDFIIAGESAIFGYSEVKIGFIPAIVMVYLLRKIGDTKARRLLLSAENISAIEAEHIGLITQCVPDGELNNAVQTLAETLLKNSSSSMALTKDMLANLHGMSLEAGLNYAASMNAFTRMTDDCKHGIQSFLNK